MITKSELYELKQRLPRGAQARIARDKGCTPGYVSQVLDGLRFDMDILNMAIAIRDKHIEIMEDLKRRLQTPKNNRL